MTFLFLRLRLEETIMKSANRFVVVMYTPKSRESSFLSSNPSHGPKHRSRPPPYPAFTSNEIDPLSTPASRSVCFFRPPEHSKTLIDQAFHNQWPHVINSFWVVGKWEMVQALKFLRSLRSVREWDIDTRKAGE